MTNTLKCYQYDVDFEPSISDDNRPLRYKIFKAAKQDLETILGKFNFSGKNIFALKNLNHNDENKIYMIDSV